MSGITGESEWFSLSPASKPQPKVVSVLVTETLGENSFYKFLGEVLTEENERAIGTAISNSVIPTLRDTAKLSEAEKEKDLKNKADQDLGAAITALVTCRDATSNVASAAAQARGAMRQANYSASLEKGSESEVFSRSVISAININLDESAVRAACAAALVGLS